MTEKKIVVPEGMLKAVADRCADYCKYGGTSQSVKFVSQTAVEAALLWLSENPILPTDEQLFDVSGNLGVTMAQIVWSERDRALIAEWQRRMLLAPEPEVPEEIKDLILPDIENGFFKPEVLNDRIIQAFRRGKQAK